MDVTFAEGTVFRKRVKQPSSEEVWYAGYIREMEGVKSMDEDEEEEDEDDTTSNVDGRRAKNVGGQGVPLSLIHISEPTRPY